MIPALREEFNRNYTPARYKQLLQNLDKACGTHVGFPRFGDAMLRSQAAA